jgi:hypothetical protein
VVTTHDDEGLPGRGVEKSIRGHGSVQGALGHHGSMPGCELPRTLFVIGESYSHHPQAEIHDQRTRYRYLEFEITFEV